MTKSRASRCLPVLLVGVCLWTTGATSPRLDSPPTPLSGAETRVTAHRWVFDVARAQWTPVVLAASLRADVRLRSEAAAGREFSLSTAAGWQIAPVVAWNDAQGEFLAVWEDFRNGSDRDLYAQRFDANGCLIGDNHAVVIGQYDQAEPVLLHEKTGGYVLIWHHQQHLNDAVYWQRLSATGAPQGAPQRVPSPLGRQQWIPGAAFNESRNEFLVVWEDLSTSEILGQRIACESGEALGDPIVVSSRPKLQWTPAFVVFSPTLQEYLVVWDDLLRGDLFGQVVTADGQLRGDGLAISVATGKQFLSDLVHNEARNEYLAVWTDQRGPSADDSDVYCQRIGGGGSLLGDEQVVCGAPGLQQDCVGWYDRTHAEYMLVWWDSRDTRNGNDIHAQRISAGGALLGPDIEISSNASDQVYPALAHRETGDQYGVVWQEWRVLNEHDVDADVRATIYTPLRFYQRFPWITQNWQESHGME